MSREFYPQIDKQFDKNQFLNPSSEYRGAPLFSWNTSLRKDQLLKHLSVFKEMGLGGFHIHPRTGLNTPYLGKEFMDAVRLCVEESKRLDLKCYLYDEDRWPSGAAGGLATREPWTHTRYLRWTKRPYGEDTEDPQSYWPSRSVNGNLLAIFEVCLNEAGFLESYTRHEEMIRGANVWYVYSETWEGTPWFNGNPYIDTLSKDAMKGFIDSTHERYAKDFQLEFGTTIPSIFSDEPQFPYYYRLDHHDQHRDISMPYTANLPETFRVLFGVELVERLPEIVWDLPGEKVNTLRYQYINHVTDRFVEAFADQVGEWCQSHDIALTGHMMEEHSLFAQTRAVGDAMRSYRSFQLPGIDMLCDKMELLTAKQAQSASRQFGREGVMSELYGVTNWDFDFAGHKFQGDWQAALGVTLRVHHLTWLSMAGEAKRDYPASIGYQSPWASQYSIVEDHFARLNYVLTRGKPVCRVAVFHPIESFWLQYGPHSTSGKVCDQLDENLEKLIEWLLFNGYDFDFVNESLIESLDCAGGDGLKIGEMTYDVVLIPEFKTIRSSTLNLLKDFHGELIYLGRQPDCIDGHSVDSMPVFPRQRKIDFNREAVLDSLGEYASVRFVTQAGEATSSILFQLRSEDEHLTLFACNGNRTTPLGWMTVSIEGAWSPTILDTLTGAEHIIHADIENGWTSFAYEFHAHGSLLVELNPVVTQTTPMADAPSESEELSLGAGPWEYTMSEPNVLVLDQAKYRINQGPWQEADETLRIENIVRTQLGLTLNNGQLSQPWADTEPLTALATVELEFEIHTEIDLRGLSLAIEVQENTQIFIDDIAVPLIRTGYFVDEDIPSFAIPDLAAGTHILRVITPFHRRSCLEWCYLLGDFGVEVKGRDCKLIERPRKLSWGSWVEQGLPFYAGNVTYHVDFECPQGGYVLKPDDFRAPLLTASLDSGEELPIAFAPFEVQLGTIETGRHRLNLTAFGSRINAFGQLHCTDKTRKWFGPESWRTTGENYSYEYQLKPCGILSEPRLYRTIV